MDLGGGFDQVLEVGAEKEVAEVDEFAMVLILNYRYVSIESPEMLMTVYSHH